MQPISKTRFNSLAGYSRSPTMPLIAEEKAWFEEGNEKILGLLVFDLTDRDYACYILGRDKNCDSAPFGSSAPSPLQTPPTIVLNPRWRNMSICRQSIFIRAMKSDYLWIFSHLRSPQSSETFSSAL